VEEKKVTKKKTKKKVAKKVKKLEVEAIKNFKFHGVNYKKGSKLECFGIEDVKYLREYGVIK